MIFFLVALAVCIPAASYMAFRGWGLGPALGTLFGLSAVALFVPFGALIAFIASFSIYGKARVAAMERAIALDDSPIDLAAFE